jgi:serine/threonine protein kinase
MLTDDGRRRLMQEARAASILQHPNIVTLHDVGSHDGIDFLVMEYVAGETLDQRIQRTGPLPPDEMLRIGMSLASALSHAHNHGLIHRDLKPANVIITAEGTAKLLDFGLAKRLWTETAPENDMTQTQLALTEEGAIVGTISYMSPEQAEGRPLDARSDIFSLGAVLYEMASGRPPSMAQISFRR